MTRRVGPWRALYLIARGVVLETTRRQEFQLVTIMLGLLLAMMILVRVVGIENPATGTLMLNLAMTIGYHTALIFTLLLVCGLVPKELENRTAHLLLARPLTRGQFLLGKWAAVVFMGVMAMVVLLLATWLPAPRMEVYSGALLGQLLVLAVSAVVLMATLGLALSLVVPPPVVVVVLGLLLGAGGWLGGFLRAAGARLDGPLALLGRLADYLPPFSNLNVLTRYTDGIGALAAGDFLRLLAAVAVYTIFALTAAAWLFERRAV